MKKATKNLLISVFSVLILMQIAEVITFATGIFSFGWNVITLVFWASFALLVLFSVLWLRWFFAQKKKKKELAKKQAQVDISNADLLYLYEIFGIPPQFKKNGTLKNFYELLGIDPQYDENGERILTIYELLGIPPRFDGEGREVPVVVFVKNYSRKFVLLKTLAGSSFFVKIRPGDENFALKKQEKTESGTVSKKDEVKKEVKKETKKEGKKQEKKKEKSRVVQTFSTAKVNSKPIKIEAGWGDLLKAAFGGSGVKVDTFAPKKQEQPLVKSIKPEPEPVKEAPKIVLEPVKEAPKIVLEPVKETSKEPIKLLVVDVDRYRNNSHEVEVKKEKGGSERL